MRTAERQPKEKLNELDQKSHEQTATCTRFMLYDELFYCHTSLKLSTRISEVTTYQFQAVWYLRSNIKGMDDVLNSNLAICRTRIKHHKQWTEYSGQKHQNYVSLKADFPAHTYPTTAVPSYLLLLKKISLDIWKSPSTSCPISLGLWRGAHQCDFLFRRSSIGRITTTSVSRYKAIAEFFTDYLHPGRPKARLHEKKKHP